MASLAIDPRQHARELIDRLSDGQATAVVGLLEVMVDPVVSALANARFDDEPLSEAEMQDIAHARAEASAGQVVPNEHVLADLGLSAEDFLRMAHTPLSRTPIP